MRARIFASTALAYLALMHCTLSGLYGCGRSEGAPHIPATRSSSVAASAEAPKDGWTLAEFRKKNTPRVVAEIPRDSVLSLEERRIWTPRLLDLAKHHLAQPADALTQVGDHWVLTPAASRARVAGVTVVFSPDFFFRKPYAEAAYDRASRTLFVPLAALEKPWDTLPAIRHEWRHAALHANALNGDKNASALMSFANRPKYAPDRFNVDEVLVNVCDLIDTAMTGDKTESWRREMTAQYLQFLRDEIHVLDNAQKEKPPALERAVAQDGIPGIFLDTAKQRDVSFAEAIWVADPRPASIESLRTLEHDSSRILAMLDATPVPVENLRAFAYGKPSAGDKPALVGACIIANPAR